MNNRLIAAIAVTVALSMPAALIAPPAYASFHSYASFKGKKQSQLKAEKMPVNAKSKNLPKSTKSGAPKVKLKNPQGNLPPHPP